MDRHIDFEAIENFRDFGGYATGCGRGVKAGRLYRSGDHSRATEADLARLAALRVAAIVDLRQPSERLRDPSRRWDGFAAAVIESDILSEHADWVEVLKTAPMTPEWFYEDGFKHYRNNAFEPRHVDLFRRFMRTLGEAEGAVVVHCAAGKDRTGLACALVHHIAGVHHDDLMADFLLTNDEARLQRKMEQAGAWIESVCGKRPSDAAMRVCCSVHAAHLDTAFESIRERHGSVDDYVRDVLGVDETLCEAIHDRVLG